MGTIAISHPRIVKGGEQAPRDVIVKTAEAVVFGQMLGIDGDGLLVEGVTDMSNFYGTSKKTVTGDGTLTCPVNGINGETEIMMNVYHSNSALSITAKSQVGQQYGVITDSTDPNILRIALEDVSDKRVIVVGLACDLYKSEELLGDTHGRLIVKVLPNYIGFKP